MNQTFDPAGNEAKTHRRQLHGLVPRHVVEILAKLKDLRISGCRGSGILTHAIS